MVSSAVEHKACYRGMSQALRTPSCEPPGQTAQSRAPTAHPATMAAQGTIHHRAQGTLCWQQHATTLLSTKPVSAVAADAQPEQRAGRQQGALENIHGITWICRTWNSAMLAPLSRAAYTSQHPIIQPRLMGQHAHPFCPKHSTTPKELHAPYRSRIKEQYDQCTTNKPQKAQGVCGITCRSFVKASHLVQCNAGAIEQGCIH